MYGLRLRSSMVAPCCAPASATDRPIGDCPRCGQMLEGSTECWFDAESIVTEHLLTCPVPQAAPAS